MAGQLLGRGATELGPLLNTSAEDVEAMRQKLHDMGAVMSDEAVKNSATFQDSLTDLKAAFSGASNGLAAELLPNLTKMMDGITDFIADGGLQKIIDGFKILAPIVAGAAVAMGSFKAATAISQIIEGVSQAIGILTGVTTAQTAATTAQTTAQVGLNAAIAANPIGALITLVVTLASAFATLVLTNDKFREGFIAACDAIREGFEAAADFIKKKIDELAEGFHNLVEDIKGVLGIHSPSKVFAGIGENMALGLGEGWDSEFGDIKKDIENSMDFGTANVDFASSGLGQSSRAIAGGVMAAASSGGDQDIVINITSEIDGAVLARKMYRYNQDEDFLRNAALSPA